LAIICAHVRRLVLLLAVVLAAPGGTALACGEDVDRAQALLEEAVALHERGEAREAYDRYCEALRLLEETSERESILLCRLNASVLAASLGRYEDALGLARGALALAEALEDPEAIAKAHNNVAVACQYLGQSDEALLHYGRATERNRERGDLEGVSTNRNNLGVVLFNLGRYSEAMAASRQAVALARSHPAERWSDEQRRIAETNLAAVYEKLGEHRIAFDLYRRLLSEEGLPEAQEAYLRTSLGRTYLHLEDPRRALECFEEAARRLDELGDAGARSNALLHVGATLCESLKEHARAQAVLARALSISTQIQDRNERLFDLLYLGRCLLHTADIDEARRRFLEAAREADAIGSAEGRWASLFGLSRIAEREGHESEALRMYRDALDVLEAQRGRHVGEDHRAGFLEDKEEVCTSAVRLVIGGPAAPEPSPQAISDGFRLVERFRARSLLDRLGAPVLPLEAAQQGLGKSEALVEFVCSNDVLLAFVVTRSSRACLRLWASGDPARRIAEACRALPGTGPAEVARVLEPISSEVLEPILLSLPAGIDSLVVVPDGPLHAVPFAALAVRAGTTPAFLAERFTLAVAPSASVHAALRSRSPRSHVVDLAAIADPILPQPGAADSASAASELDSIVARHGLGRLRRSSAEAHRIAEIVPGRRGVREGPGATAASFWEIAREAPRILHLATHTVVDAAGEEGSAILFTPPPGGSGGRHRARGRRRSGVDPLRAGRSLVVPERTRTHRARRGCREPRSRLSRRRRAGGRLHALAGGG
jgi:tetratricopeptide (TPR) repeat protein